MRFCDYQVAAVRTAIYPRDVAKLYLALGLCGEAGEIAEHIKKSVRDSGGVITADRQATLAKEAGDVLWYLTMLCTELDLSLDEVARANLDKLRDRANRGVLSGNGDQR